MNWDDIRFHLTGVLASLLILTLIPVALVGGYAGGYILIKYIYCDVVKLCEVMK
jgi:hypothetical protein